MPISIPRCDAIWSPSQIAPSVKQISVAYFFNPMACVQVFPVFGHAKEEVVIQLLHIEFSATAIKD